MGLGSLVCSRVLAQGQLLTTCLQSFCLMAKGAQEPPKVPVLLQQALGLPDIVLGGRGRGSCLGRWGQHHLAHCWPQGHQQPPPQPLPIFKAPPSDGEAALQPCIPGPLPQACPAAGRPRVWHRWQ